MPDLSSLLRNVDGDDPFNTIHFIVRNMLGRVSTATLVQVVSSTNSGSVAPPGFVDVTPLVNLLDGNDKAIEHGIIYRCPVMRLQGGGNAVIIDPVAGDIGIAVFADRDITSVIANKARSNPGSFRRFSMADAMYLGAVLAGVPTQWVRMSSSGIEIHSPTAVVLTAPDVHITAPTVEIDASTSVTVTTPIVRINGATQLNGPLQQVPGSQSGGGSTTLDGPIAVTNDVTAAGKSVSTHHHGGVTTGGGNTGGPV